MSRIAKTIKNFAGHNEAQLIDAIRVLPDGGQFDWAVMTLWNLYESEMIAYMERRGLYPQEVDDALSESFRRFHRQARRLDPARSPEGWIRNIVSGEITRELLHRKSLEEGWDNLELAEQIARDPAVGTANPDPQFDNEHLMDPLDILIQQEELPEAQQEVGAWFKATFSKLQRDVFLAVMDEGLPYHEVSKRLHIPEFKIQDIMKLMRRKIRERAGWVSNRSPTLF